MTPEMQETIAGVQESWQDISYEQVLEEHQNTPSIDYDNDSSRAYVLSPEGEIDEDKSVALFLPHLNGWTPHHLIRAKIMQQVVAPDSRVVVFPNNSMGQQNYDVKHLSEQDKKVFSYGSLDPIAKKHMRTLETINRYTPLGALSLTGYSLGARMALDLAQLDSDRLEGVTHVNADEAPSVNDRGPLKLAIDFAGSGGSGALKKSIHEAEIPSLSKAMRFNRRNFDVAKFLIKDTFSTEAKTVKMGITSTISLIQFEGDLLHGKSIPKVKIGYVEGSKMFDSEAGGNSYDKIADVVRYEGEHFHGHPSADNVILHALMVNDGINPR